MRTIKLLANNLYANGYIITLQDGRQFLKRNKISGLARSSKDIMYTIKDGDNLWDLAYQYYGDPQYYFIIADVNNIEMPLELEVGTDIIIPNFQTAKLALQ